MKLLIKIGLLVSLVQAERHGIRQYLAFLYLLLISCICKFKTHYLDQVLCGGPSFCFVLFFHTYVSSKIDEITLFRYKAQNEAKRKKERTRHVVVTDDVPCRINITNFLDL